MDNAKLHERPPIDRPNGDGDAPVSPTAERGAALDSSALDLTAVRDLVLLAHPDVIPELVSGSTFDELIGSIETARAAYQRIVEAVHANNAVAPAASSAPKIPAGGGQRQVSISADQLSAAAKISEGLRQRNRRSA